MLRSMAVHGFHRTWRISAPLSVQSGKMMLRAAAFLFCLAIGTLPFHGHAAQNSDDLFQAVQRLRIEIPPDGVAVLREYHQVWKQKRPERVDVNATVRDGTSVYTNVAVHLKGSISFQPFDSKPSLTLNFDKLAPGQRFHGLSKLHLNNSIQDDSFLCEKLARELFESLGVPAPRAGHALVKINERDLGLFVMIEGANKQFVKRHFSSAEGNLYDGGSGGEITSKLKVESGAHPDDRSDLKRLSDATRETDPAKRLKRLEEVLDVQKFINFAATEAFLVHWDGYSLGANNYRVFHDVTRDKMVFIPHGLDQLFGVSRSVSLGLTPPFKGLVAKALFSVPEARQRYLTRISELAQNELRAEALNSHIDRLASQLRPSLSLDQLAQLEQAWTELKSRVVQRCASVAQQLKNPRHPLALRAGQSFPLTAWSFKAGLTPGATGSRRIQENRDFLTITCAGIPASGSWRTTVLLDSGHYTFSGSGYTEGLTPADLKGTNGMILRASGERSTKGIAIADSWRPLSYDFDVHGIEDVELVCEFRGARGAAHFDGRSMRLVRKGSDSATAAETSQ